MLTPTATRPRLAEARLAPAPRTGRAARCHGQLRRNAARVRPIVFVHGLTGSWQAWLENMPSLRGPGPPRDRSRPARLRRQPDAPGRSTSPPMGGSCTILRAARRLAARHPGRQLDGRPDRGRGGRSRPRSASTAGPRLGGRSHRHLARHTSGARNLAGMGHLRPSFRLRLRASSSPTAAPATPCSASRSATLAAAQGAPLGANAPPVYPAPASPTPVNAVIEYDIRDRLEEIEIPVMIVWGSRRLGDPVGGRPQLPTSHLPLVPRDL